MTHHPDDDTLLADFIPAPPGIAAEATWNEPAKQGPYGLIDPYTARRRAAVVGWGDEEPFVVEPTTGRLVRLAVWHAQYAELPGAALWVGQDFRVSIPDVVLTTEMP